MDDVTAALRRYEILRPKDDKLSAIGAASFSHWLEHDVCVVAEHLIENPEFQTNACWPIDHLSPGVKTPERELVDEVDRLLVKLARLLAEFIRHDAVREALLRPTNRPDREWSVPPGFVALPTVTFGGIREKAEASTLADAAEERQLSNEWSADFIASRPWWDLVTVWGYFLPLGELHLKDRKAYLGPDSDRTGMGEFLPMCQPVLRPLGDFISRMLLLRIDHWLRSLRRLLTSCQSVRSLGDPGAWQQIEDTYCLLLGHVETLRNILRLTMEAVVRDACIVLVQVLAEYRPQMDFRWLGLREMKPPYYSCIRDSVEKRCDLALVDQVAQALSRVEPIYHRASDADDLLQTSLETHRLVVVSGSGRREVYWEGDKVDVDWSRFKTRWEFIELLAAAAKSGFGTGSNDLEESKGSWKDARSRLKRDLPPRLDELILPAGRNTYRLNLLSDEICILQGESVDQLVAT